MPASTVSSSLSWGAYLVAASCLLGALTPAVTGVSQRALAAAQASDFGSAVGAINGLEPGESIRLVYGSVPGEGALQTAGHRMSLETPGGALTAYSQWNLPLFNLDPGRPYVLTLQGSFVKVAPYG